MKKRKSTTVEPLVRNRVVSTRLDDKEHKIVITNCRYSGRKMSDYCRKALTGAKIRELAKPEDMALLRKIGGMATNLNQMAKRLNADGHKYESWQVVNVAKQISSLYNLLSDDWKNH